MLKGATSSIGAETARVLAKRGVRIVVPVRDLKKGAQLKERIQKESPEAKIILLEIDLSSFASIKRFCSEFLSLNLRLNILISGCGLGQIKLTVDVKSLCRNNAGKFSNKLEFSEDKIEMTFATNYLGHFLLTELLLEKMIETAAKTGTQGRIVNVSSVIHSWARRANVTINGVHPGIVKTEIIRDHKGFITGMHAVPFCFIFRTCGHIELRKARPNNVARILKFFVACKLLKSTSQIDK
ncbi:hypothetical protein RJ640_005161 [Escallonia rubra]|uniref:Uncharacterized protein n=1 Tax=Escallonia rubra TaxID=112253 RepID=A0AA88UU16_9ASTE|nr:hypothetical protein RJ640_005161 [Escallonia rubra]